MICNKCGKKLPLDSEFCQYCGDNIVEQMSPCKETLSAPISKGKCVENTTKQLADDNIMSRITSKRIAAVISIILCAILYLSFLTAFTTKRDTYICYTTKTGEHFHSITCSYINTAYETTVYEACRKYTPCKYCNPCLEKYETTYTDKNYIIPLVISVPISAAVFILLTYRKKPQRHH